MTKDQKQEPATVRIWIDVDASGSKCHQCRFIQEYTHGFRCKAYYSVDLFTDENQEPHRNELCMVSEVER